MFVQTTEPLPVGARVGLAFKLTGTQTMLMEAEVTWNTTRQKRATNPGMGLRFTRVAASDREQLRLFLGLDEAASKRVVIIEDDSRLRLRLKNAFRRAGLTVEECAWASAEAVLARPHALTVVGVDESGMQPKLMAMRNGGRTPLVTLLGAAAPASEWMGNGAQMTFNKPIDPERVVRLTSSLVR